MHLSLHREWFRDYERIPPIKIYMGDDLVQEIIGKMNIDVLMIFEENIFPRVFINVLQLPIIVKNMFYE